MPVTTLNLGERQIPPLILNIEGLLKLLGGTKAQRQRFLEQWKGLTTPAELRLIERNLEAATQNIALAAANLKTVQAAAKEIHA